VYSENLCGTLLMSLRLKELYKSFLIFVKIKTEEFSFFILDFNRDKAKYGVYGLYREDY
jgi:hypothetical protein